jgi:hypothetical protein
MAMQGLLANDQIIGVTVTKLTDNAVELADTLIEALNK